jgi:alkylation response protein AidB-like acyl-CoA dehydrogenase
MGGIHDSALANCIFEDMRVPVSARLGEENKGWAVVRATLAFERVGMPRWLNASVRLDELAAWLRSAGRLGDPGVAEALGQARSWCEAGRVLYYAVVNERRKDYANPSALSCAARAAMVKAERVVSEVALQLQAETALESSAVGSDYMEGIVAGLGGGSYEVQLNLISKMILKL